MAGDWLKPFREARRARKAGRQGNALANARTIKKKVARDRKSPESGCSEALVVCRALTRDGHSLLVATHDFFGLLPAVVVLRSRPRGEACSANLGLAMQFTRRLFVILPCITLAACVTGVTAEPSITDTTESVIKLPVNWSRGDAYRLELIKEREDFGTENPKKMWSTHVLIDVAVLRQLEDGYVIRWSYGKPEIHFDSGRDDPRFDNSFLSELGTLVGGQRVDMRTDLFGSVVGLENPDEVAASLRDAFDLLIRQLRQKGAPPERLDRLEDFTASLMTPEMLEVAALKEPMLFYALVGGTYRLGTPITFENSRPNPLGGPPIPAKGHVLLREVMPKDNSAIIEMRMTFDPEGLRKSLHDMIEAMGERVGRPVPNLPSKKEFPAAQVEDSSRFLIDTDTGWPLSLEYERNAVFGPRRRVDRYIFRVVDDRDTAVVD